MQGKDHRTAQYHQGPLSHLVLRKGEKIHLNLELKACRRSLYPDSCVVSRFLSGSPKNSRPGGPVRELLRSGFLPTDPFVPRRCALAPARLPLQLRLHPGGERRAGQPGHKSAGGREQPGKAKPGSSQLSGRLHPDTAQPRGE